MKIYVTALGDLALIAASLLTDIDPILRGIGLVVGVVVGILTMVKLFYDIKLKKIEIEKSKKG